MKTGPIFFPTTYTGSVTTSGNLFGSPNQAVASPFVTWTQIWNTQNLTASFTSLAIDCRGAYDKTVQLIGSAVSSITVVEVDASIDPQSANWVATSATWFSIGTIASTPSMLIHSGIVRAIRCRSTAVSSSDNFSVVVMLDDRG